jgi:hypothetical protein
LIAAGAANARLKDIFQTSAMLSALQKRFGFSPPCLSGARWNALSALCGGATMAAMTSVVADALSLLFKPPSGPTQDVVGAICFLGTSGPLSPVIAGMMAKSQVFQVLLGYILMFNTASHLHAAFRFFTFQVVKVPLLAEKVVQVFLPFLMAEAVAKENGFIASSCWSVLTFLQNRSASDSVLKTLLAKNPEYQSFLRLELKPFVQDLLVQYGGPLPTSPDSD